MTYQQTIYFLYEQLPMFTRIGAAAYKKDLHNTIALLDHIGNPHTKFKTIHIAGTNGKGSTSHMLAAVFHHNGYKTGLYTSPHLKDFGERIKVSGSGELEMINEDFVVRFVERMKPVIASVEPSFFELTVAMAFEYFALQQVDVAIIETGLGGRLDSTNVIMPELSIITNIGWDHMNLLGDSLGQIAYEKAGIIKKNIPVVVGETLPETRPVFDEKAMLVDAPLHYAEGHAITSVASSIEQLEITLNDQQHYTTDLPGLYQQYNIRTVTTALNVLKERGWQMDDTKTAYALSHVKSLTGLHGRWEVIRTRPYLVIDVGHNEDGIRQVLQQVAAMQEQVKQVHIITGMVQDKEVDKVLQLFPSSYRYYFTNAHIPRALPAAALQEKARVYGLEGKVYDDVNTAIHHVLSVASPDDLIIVCGSVFVVGEVDTERFKN